MGKKKSFGDGEGRGDTTTPRTTALPPAAPRRGKTNKNKKPADGPIEEEGGGENSPLRTDGGGGEEVLPREWEAPTEKQYDSADEATARRSQVIEALHSQLRDLEASLSRRASDPDRDGDGPSGGPNGGASHEENGPPGSWGGAPPAPPPPALTTLQPQSDLVLPGAYRYRDGSVRRPGEDPSEDFLVDDIDDNGRLGAPRTRERPSPAAAADPTQVPGGNDATTVGLVTAQPVDEDDEDEEGGDGSDLYDPSSMVQAKPVTGHGRWRRRRLAFAAVAAVVVVALAVSLGVALGRPRAPPPLPPSEAPSAAPTVVPPNGSAVLNEFRSGLPNSTRRALDDPTSAQAMAFQWLANSIDSSGGHLPPIFDSSPTDDDGNRMRELFALATLYYSTDGQQWTKKQNWLNYQVETECGTWQGCVCEGRWMTSLDLRGMGLSGTLPAEISLLSSLIYLWLDRSALPGPVPSELGQMTRLTYFSGDNCGFTGSIPAELGQATGITTLDVSANVLQGAIPTDIGLLRNLVYLNLYNNRLSGTLPAEIGSLSNLQALSLFGNSLNGPIPSVYGDLPSLTSLDLSSCTSLSGPIPTHLGKLTRLETLYLNSNALTGAIPTELSLLTKLGALRLQFNNLMGTVPTELGKLTRLRELSLQSNMLAGTVPAELCDLITNSGLKVTISCGNANSTSSLTCSSSCGCDCA